MPKKTNTAALKAARDELQKLRKVISLKEEEDKAKTYRHSPCRRYLKLATNNLSSAPRGAEDEDDLFYQQYKAYGLIEPFFPFSWLWKTYQECDVLTLCVRVLADNIVNPHDFEFTGPVKEKTLPANEANRIMLRDFFSRVNESESFHRLAKKVWRDRKVTGNAFVNVIRGMKLERGGDTWKVGRRPPERFYYIPSTYMRATLLEDPEQEITVNMPRGGDIIPVKIKRRFRRFARITPTTQEMTWFKELGDPRTLDSKTGKFLAPGETTPNEATEIWWLRDNYAGMPYGVSEWLGCVWDIAGRYIAKWVNFDHLDQGAIVPGVFTGPKMSQASKEAFESWQEEQRDPSAYNRIPYLQTEVDTDYDLNSADSKKTGEIKFLKVRDPQHEDFMFGGYFSNTEESIGRACGLPPVLRGIASENSYASAYTSMEIAESQVFIPTREDWDEEITTRFIQNEFGIYDWKYKTRQSRIGDKETFYRAVGALSRAGGLSINDIRELANQLLGTTFQPFEGDLYNEPLTLVSTLAENGQVGYEGNALVFVKAVVDGATQAGKGVNTAKSAEDDTDDDVESVTRAMVTGLRGLASLKYNAPTPEEIAFELLESNEKFHPLEGESKPEFLDRCIPGIIAEGHDSAQATAMCESMWTQGAA